MMTLIRETPFPVDGGPACALSCLIQRDGEFLGVDSLSGTLRAWAKDGTVTQTALTQKYEKLSYSQENQRYFAISRRAPGSVFLLDARFRELDRIGIRTGRPGAGAEDLWYDADTDLLWVVYSEAIFRFNSNGDCLGPFLTAPQATRYQALCTHAGQIFLAYQKDGCTCVSAYAPTGAHLERFSLGGEYTVCNLQAVERGGGSTLWVFARKGLRFPFTLELELTAPRPAPALSVECFTDAPQLYSTCHIDSPSDG